MHMAHAIVTRNARVTFTSIHIRILKFKITAMTKKLLLVLLLSFGTGAIMKAQLLRSHWKMTTKKISECEYDLIFTVTIDKGWHTFSIHPVKGAENDVFATEIIFTPGKDYKLVGELKETKATPEYDETINKTVYVHYNKVVFTQRIKLTGSSKVKISGTYEYQVCSNVCESPPYETFDFYLQGNGVCKK